VCHKDITKKRISWVIGLLAALSLLFLSGCVTLVEEISVEEDGSGTLTFALGVETESYEQFQESTPEGLELENLLSVLIQDENVSLIGTDNYEANGRTWERICGINFPTVAAGQRVNHSRSFCQTW